MASAARSTRASANAPPAPPVVTVNTISAIDSYIPNIPDVNADDITTQMPHSRLTKLDDEPTYDQFYIVREELYRNALAIESTLGGGDSGHLGVAMDGAAFTTLTGETWTVPAKQGIFPTFPTGATDDNKKRIIAEFIRDESARRVAEAVGKILRKQLLDCVNEEYVMELEDEIFRYDKVSVVDILAHILNNYAEIDDNMLRRNKEEFEKEPDMSLPLDVYYKKQERCQKIALDGKVPISEEEMVLLLQIHMGQSGLLNSAWKKWKALPQRKWKPGKIHFRAALKENTKLSKLNGEDSRFKANAVAKSPRQVEEEVKEDITDKLGDAFDSLAMAATAKQETMDMMARSISELTESIAQLTKTNKELTEQLKKANAKGRNTTRTDGGTSGGGGAGKDIEYPPWCDPAAYCFTCGYKVKKGHDSAHCRLKDNKGHKKEATRSNPMGGSMMNSGFGHAPNGSERK